MEIADTEIMIASKDMFARIMKVSTLPILLSIAIRAIAGRGMENENSITAEKLFL